MTRNVFIPGSVFYKGEPVRFKVWEDNGFSWMDRVRMNDGEYVTQASLTDINYKVIDLDDIATVPADIALVKTTVVFDTLQTSDPSWVQDTTGYNFKWDVPASVIPTGNKKYRIEIRFNPTSGEDYYLVAEVEAMSIYGS
jgi:hypothetical protein